VLGGSVFRGASPLEVKEEWVYPLPSKRCAHQNSDPEGMHSLKEGDAKCCCEVLTEVFASHLLLKLLLSAPV